MTHFSGQLWDETFQTCGDPDLDSVDDNEDDSNSDAESVGDASGEAQAKRTEKFEETWIRCSLISEKPNSKWSGPIHIQTGELRLRKASPRKPVAADTAQRSKFSIPDSRRFSAALCAAQAQAELVGPDPFRSAGRQVRTPTHAMQAPRVGRGTRCAWRGARQTWKAPVRTLAGY